MIIIVIRTDFNYLTPFILVGISITLNFILTILAKKQDKKIELFIKKINYYATLKYTCSYDEKKNFCMNSCHIYSYSSNFFFNAGYYPRN